MADPVVGKVRALLSFAKIAFDIANIDPEETSVTIGATHRETGEERVLQKLTLAEIMRDIEAEYGSDLFT